MADELANPVVVDFPLRGEGWVAVNSPANRIPSHGTDMLGQRYAYDFLRVDQRKRHHYHAAGLIRTLVLGVPTRECHAWGAPIHSVFDGEIVQAVDRFPERSWVHPVRELALVIKNGLTFTPARLPSLLGNHVIARREDLVAVFAHLAPGSVTVQERQVVQTGEVIGRVGHTGNSTTPHLHFQLMDTIDPNVAHGVACAFRTYEVLREGTWHPEQNGIPGGDDRIRVIEPKDQDGGRRL